MGDTRKRHHDVHPGTNKQMRKACGGFTHKKRDTGKAHVQRKTKQEAAANGKTPDDVEQFLEPFFVFPGGEVSAEQRGVGEKMQFVENMGNVVNIVNRLLKSLY
jgi:hypothetical protein